MGSYKDVFISYGRRDSKHFARLLYERLRSRGYSVWFDFEDIPTAADFQKQIDDDIPKARNFVFVISPHASKSPYCRRELERAIALNKRIIPIMHVEEIMRATWQSRNPGGTDEGWALYRASGEHSCFTYMHPEISKLNWNQLNFSDIDNFENPFQALLDLLEQERSYVHLHTKLLNKALEWKRNQKQTQYLLVGKERQQAEVWLKKRFEDKQPPCHPNTLHCQYITESIKNANNLMTQVFLCHAEQDRAIAERIDRTLMREGITTWTHHDDIEFGSDFKAAMVRGMEEADNVVFLMSAKSLDSQYCRQELDHARSLHKRIIPIQIDGVNPEHIPPLLEALQYIDLTGDLTEDDYQQRTGNLLRILAREPKYHNKHKIWLTKALKWDRQNRNPSILLRGYELQNAKAWLKLARQNTDYGPIPLQEEFIRESERQPPGQLLDVFISYSRSDADFVRKLNDNLQIQGKRTWFDQESIASGADFQQEIYRGIESSDHFLFVLSPSSVQSSYCSDEVEYAAKLNKRIVTVLHRDVQITTLHPELAKVQWIDFQANNEDFTANFQELIRTLDTDPEYLQNHTRLLMQAIAWDNRSRRENRLLRGEDLFDAEQWLLTAKQKGKEPTPTDLQQEYIVASRELWSQLQSIEESRQQTTQLLQTAIKYHRPKATQIILTSLIISVLVVIARPLGLLSWFELAAFDGLHRLMPTEEQDSKITIIEVTEDDIEAQLQEADQGAGSLSDTRLNRLLKILESQSPRAIGLDLYRNFESKLPELSQRMADNDRLIATCKEPETKGNEILGEGVSPPPNVPLTRVGFSDVLPDKDNVVRRQLLWHQPIEDSPCLTEISFSLQLAKQYLLLDKTIDIMPEEIGYMESQKDLFIGDTVVPSLIKIPVLIVTA